MVGTAAMFARLEREQEMAKKKGAKSSVSGADVADNNHKKRTNNSRFHPYRRIRI